MGAPAAPGFVVGTPECAVKFGALYANPFVASHSACLPLPPSPASFKLSVFIKNTFTVGTNGVGFVQASPGLSVANDNDTLWASGSTYTGLVTASSGTGVFASRSNSPFLLAEFGTAQELQYRLVAVGLRVRYRGTELNRGGATFGLAQPDRYSLDGFSIADMRAYDAVHSMPVSSENWVSLTATNLTTGAYGNALLTNPWMAFLVGSTAGNIFEYEYVAHYEVIGDSARGKTPSHTAVKQTAAIQDVSSSNYAAVASTQPLSRTISEALEATAEIATKAGAAAASVGNFLVGANKMKNYFLAGAPAASEMALALL